MNHLLPNDSELSRPAKEDKQESRRQKSFLTSLSKKDLSKYEDDFFGIPKQSQDGYFTNHSHSRRPFQIFVKSAKGIKVFEVFHDFAVSDLVDQVS